MSHEKGASSMQLSLSDPEMLEHIREKTDLIKRFQDTKDISVVETVDLESDDFQNFLADWLKNESCCIDSFDKVVRYYDENMAFSHNVLEHQGIYFYESIECDDVGYWLDRKEAINYARDSAS
jgi:hypothetical protein